MSPNNGLLTLIAERDGVAEDREIDEKPNRMKGSVDSYVFHGRNVYAYTGARLASGKITFAQVGPNASAESLVRSPYQRAEKNGGVVKVRLRIFHEGKLVDETVAPYHNTFEDVPEGQPLVYLNSLLNVSVAINMDSFAAKHKAESGPSWSLEVSKAE